MPRTPDLTLQQGQSVGGFRVLQAVPLDEIRAAVYLIAHEASGARILHVHTDDSENLFSVSFPTPPPDDTGMPHILEHAVLAGSRRYPVREPFFEMVKISMATFINAMTGHDCTYYPVASNVRKDLFNLAEVYFDAVFHPLLTERTFRREGHHLAPADPGNPAGALTVNGIVFNEMKGVYSDPESRLYRCVTHALFPDSIYGRDSGGDPSVIPSLSYAALKRFHARYYHPSNALFFLYGSIPTAAHLEFLSGKLARYRRAKAAPAVVAQPRWSAPRSMEDTYPIGDDEPLAEKTYLGLHWITGATTDVHDMLMQGILSLVLLGNEGAPLRKAIIDAGLGADLVFSGLDSVGMETTFSLDLKGSEPERAGAFTELVTRSLEAIAARDIPRESVEAAFQQAAYQQLEIVQMHPLSTMQRVLHAWVYGADPLTFLRMAGHMTEARAAWERDPGVLNRMIRERLLENPHRLASILRPDREVKARMDSAFAAQMGKVRARLSEAQARAVAAEAAELDEDNGQPNPPEALARLPQLGVKDLPEHLTHVATSVDNVAGVPLLRNDVFANGVSYLVLDFDLRGLPPDLWPFVPHYAECVGKLGAFDQGYEEVARRTALHTGGISCYPVFTTHAFDAGRPLWRMRLRMKALDRNMVSALSVLHDLLFGLNPGDAARLREIVRQTRARQRTDIVYEGSSTAGRRAGRGLTPEGHLAEVVSGLPQLELCDRLAGQFEAEAAGLAARIQQVRDFLLNRNRLTVSYTGDEAFGAVGDALARWVADMRSEKASDAGTGFAAYAQPPREGLAAPIEVAHCARVMPAPHTSHPDEALLEVGTHLVGLDFMMPEIRLKGNAYGAWLRYNSFGSTLSLGSYRDPHVVETLTVFDRVVDYVQTVDWTQTEIDRAIIAVAKRSERPIRPGAATSEALDRHLNGLTPEAREARYARLRRTTPAEVRRSLLQVFESGQPRAATCVVASRATLESANAQMKSAPLAIQDIAV